MPQTAPPQQPTLIKIGLDFNGDEVRVGDEVAYPISATCLLKGKVLSVGPLQFTVSRKPLSLREQPFVRRYHYVCVKIKPKKLTTLTESNKPCLH